MGPLAVGPMSDGSRPRTARRPPPRGSAGSSPRARPCSRPGSERGVWRVILEENPPTRFGQEPCPCVNMHARG